MQQYQRVHLPAHRGTASIGLLYSVMSEGCKRVVNGNLKLTPFTLKQQSKIDPFDDLLRLNLWLNSYSLFIF